MNSTNITTPDRRVVITGMGIACAAGLELDRLWNAIRGGISGVIPYPTEGDSRVPFINYAPASCFTGDIADFGELDPGLKKDLRKSLKLMSREIQMGVAAAQRALFDAKISRESLPPDRVGVSFAADYILTTAEELKDGIAACSTDGRFDFSRWADEGKTKMTPIWQLKFLSNMTTSHITILNGFHGVGNAITNREASIGAAVGEATEIIKSGKVDVVVVGATGSRIHPNKLLTSVLNEKLAGNEFPPEKSSRPFDRDRKGAVLSEGAGALILESADHAIRRGAVIRAEVLGGAYNAVITRNPDRTSDRFFPLESQVDITESLSLSLRSLLKKTGFDPVHLGHISANGVGTPNMDAAEASAIRAIFGDLADSLPVTTVKGHFGNPGAGGGAIELIASVLALQNGVLYPILNNENDSPDCPICPVRVLDTPAGDSFIKTACQSFGQTSAILVRRFNG